MVFRPSVKVRVAILLARGRMTFLLDRLIQIICLRVGGASGTLSSNIAEIAPLKLSEVETRAQKRRN